MGYLSVHVGTYIDRVDHWVSLSARKHAELLSGVVVPKCPIRQLPCEYPFAAIAFVARTFFEQFLAILTNPPFSLSP